MTILYADFNGTARAGLAGFTTYSTTAGADGFDTTGAGTAKTDSTGTNLAVPLGTYAADHFVQFTAATTNSTSFGLLLRGTKINASATDSLTTGYVVRHNGSNILCAVFPANGGTPTTLATYTHTLSAGDSFRATIVGNRIRVYINGSSTAVIDQTDSTWATGNPMLRVVGNGVEVNEAYLGDMADIAQVGTISDNTGSGGSGGGGTPVVVPDVVTSDVPTTGIPAYKGLIKLPSGRILTAGKLVHTRTHSFFQAAGTPVLPDWLSVTGTATVTDPASTLSRLDLTTAATAGAKASLLVTPAVNMTSYSRIQIDIEAFQFLIAAPAAIFRLGLIGNAGVMQANSDDYVFLHSGGEVKRTTGNKYSVLSPSATQRRQISVIICPADQEVFLLEDGIMRMFHIASRWTSASWTNAQVALGLQIEATTATAVSARMSSITMSLYA